MYLTRKVNYRGNIMKNSIHHTDSIQHFQYHNNKNIISNVTYERTHVPHLLLKRAYNKHKWHWKKFTMEDIIKIELRISFLDYISKSRKCERAQAVINWEDSAPCCFAMKVIYKRVLFWMLLKYQRRARVKNRVRDEWSLTMLLLDM